ncbi:hypothetical protein [Aeromicrobium massiliense]|uniref:hypothetical protein n=1 Tax=Aeromicrobium massiliense TaxID=1464554 RepID=UPI000578A02A|nr:hypothetical protein [Aeromicrobium massiliense]
MSSTRRPAALAAGLALVLSFFAGGAWQPAAAADPAPTSVVLNPDGGVRPDGSDGLRFAVNKTPGVGMAPAGSDDPYLAGTSQWCCSGGAPMLSVGGTLFGTAGPASGQPWKSVEVISTSGDATTATAPLNDGTRTVAGGESEAVVRYTAEKGGLSYVVTRTLSYTFPNQYVDDAYSFEIPPGSTDAVKFYYGGDSAPGSSDQGYGIMLTQPVRSVISLNPSSGILVGVREMPGSKPFDGARAASFYDPYSVVQAGNDIGFQVETAIHDAGLMTQWNLGSTPGVQQAEMRHIVGFQGTNLDARFDRASVRPGDVANLDVSIENLKLAPASALGWTLELPAGLTAAGAPVNSCSGTVTTSGRRVELSGASVATADNCVVRLPVRASGTVTLTGTSFVATAGGLENRVGTSRLTIGKPATPPTPPVVKAPTVGLTASTDVVAEGGSVTLTWRSTDVTALTATGAWKGAVAATGTRTVKLGRAGTHVFALSAKNATGRAADRVSVRVLPRKTLKAVAPTTVVRPGSAQTVTARGLAAGEKVTVVIGGKVAARGTADAAGVARVRVVVPRSAGSRPVVQVRGAVAGRVGSVRLNVAVPEKLKPLRLPRSAIRASDHLKFDVQLLPGEKVSVRYKGKVVATGRADADGRYRVSFNVGRTWGKRTVKVTGATRDRKVTVKFRVVERCVVERPRVCD